MKYYSSVMRQNQHGQTIVDDNDIIDGWLSGRNPTNVIVDEIETINIYNAWCDTYESEDKITAKPEYEKDDYIEQCMSNWAMPEHYKELDIVKFINDKKLTYQERDRVHMEIEMYRERGMIPVLRFLVYLVDLCKENNVVLGSIKYNLNIKEFLK